MGVPVSQMWTVASYVIGKKLRGVKRYPLVLMLEPLFRCNLACAGCGKIQYPADILRRHLTPEQCFKAVDECGAPMVSIPGGEPLLHPQIGEIVAGLVARKKYVYLCTNAILLENLQSTFPSRSISMDRRKSMILPFAVRVFTTWPSVRSKRQSPKGSASRRIRPSTITPIRNRCGKCSIT